jgi:death on curing protein
MNEPVWINRRVLLHLHLASLAEFGGASGIRDANLLDSALARPVNRFHYEPAADIPALAASYGYGLAKNHPFVDGNKRAAFHSVILFLALNGRELSAEIAECILVMLSVASDGLSEEQFAAWIRANSEKQPSSSIGGKK